MKKVIKKSNRGLTFSFEGASTNFNIGDKYKYIVDPKSNKVHIVPSDNDTDLTVSKKKVGTKIKSLIDLRSKTVKEIFNNAELLEINIKDDKIVISILKETLQSKVLSTVSNSLKSNKVINICNKLKRYKKVEEIILDTSLLNAAAGDITHKALNSIIEDITINEWYSSSEEIESVTQGLDTTIKVLSVFSGAGMLDFGLFLDNDFEIVKAIEYNPSACESYKANIGDIVVNDDIRNYEVDGEYDLLWGGPPCTPYSNSNRVNRLENHKDIDLVQEYIRILKSSNKFKAFVMENVPQMLTANNGKYLKNIKEGLKDYDINYTILRDNECGGYTTRKRAFIFGSKIGNVVINKIKKVGKTVGDAIKKVTSKWFNFNDYTKPSEYTKLRMSYVPEGGNWSDIPKELWQPSYKVGKTHSNTFKRLAMDMPCITLANFRKCNLVHPLEDRGLTVAEALAISGFDERFKVLGTLSDKQVAVANGVPFYLGVTVKNIIKRVFFKYYYGENISVY